MRLVFSAVVVVTITLCTSAQGMEGAVLRTYVACTTEAVFDRFNEIRRSRDDAAFKRYVLEVLTSGSCITLKPGDRVFYERRTGPLSSYVIIRPRGQTESFVTYRDLIEFPTDRRSR